MGRRIIRLPRNMLDIVEFSERDTGFIIVLRSLATPRTLNIPNSGNQSKSITIFIYPGHLSHNFLTILASHRGNQKNVTCR
ncbi:hypothetical protein [Calothrix sp. PCC 6303]|uniref:hypothetical protein n=1 Tax=Calothrix sp. PCC 6303 TaxID=1170562 RepID=UPI0002A02457|nr:hypothetical protein [Calothrix sp. PCC 6303]AFZ01203.1 hypothetical protein Cal6303_2182 [Calothrix sp. PCC 6303]